jgi:hypothetical protein
MSGRAKNADKIDAIRYALKVWDGVSDGQVAATKALRRVGLDPLPRCTNVAVGLFESQDECDECVDEFLDYVRSVVAPPLPSKENQE